MAAGGIAHPHRRSRTQSDNASVLSNATGASSSSANVAGTNAVAPGAPRIGTGNWGTAPAAMASQDTFEELLDTVVEGDSYEGKGLGIEAGSRSASNTDEAASSQSQDELMESVAEQHLDHLGDRDSSNDTFELDLDQAFNEQGTASASVQAGQVSMQIDGKSVLVDDSDVPEASSAVPRTQSRKRGHSTSLARHSAKKSEMDPDDWLALRATVQREAEQRVLEVQKEYREELDVWDISMVAEYSEEIFEYMEELEVCFYSEHFTYYPHN